ncbi:MAG: FAD-binding protein, partial [Duodenibacillus sp.]|nr:FAD-binding protein [Duodenibacillus sp.]
MTFAKQTLFAAALAAVIAAPAAQAAVKDGVYQSRVYGHNAPVFVTVTIKDGKIAGVDASKNLESPGVGKLALVKMSERIVKSQTIALDNITGATLSSMAIKSAVGECLEKAGAGDEFEKPLPPQSTAPVTLKTEVVIVGGGGSGLAAAVSALENGANVVIVEKMGFLGGSTNVCGGAFNAAGTKYQKALGIEDNPQKHFEQTMKGGHMTNDPEMVKALTERAPATFQWMQDLGCVINPKVGAATGALYQRSHYPNPAGGNTYVRTLEKTLAKYGPDRLTVLLETKAEEIVMKDGRAVGVKAMNGKRPVTVMASKGVVVSTGGFGSNVKYRQKVNTGIWKEAVLDERIGCSNISVAAQGEGLIMAEKVGAQLIGLADIQVHPNGTPGTGLMLDIKTSGRNRLFINDNGDRFVNEGAARDVLSKAVFAQPNQGYWLVQNHLRYPDENAIDLLSGRTMHDMLEQGRVKRCENLEELAKLMKVDLNRLKAAIEEYNKAARHEVAADKFGFKANHNRL